LTRLRRLGVAADGFREFLRRLPVEEANTRGLDRRAAKTATKQYVEPTRGVARHRIREPTAPKPETGINAMRIARLMQDFLQAKPRDGYPATSQF